MTKFHNTGKTNNLHQACGIFCCVVRMLVLTNTLLLVLLWILMLIFFLTILKAQCSWDSFNGEQRSKYKRISIFHHVCKTASSRHEVYSVWKVCLYGASFKNVVKLWKIYSNRLALFLNNVIQLWFLWQSYRWRGNIGWSWKDCSKWKNL